MNEIERLRTAQCPCCKGSGEGPEVTYGYGDEARGVMTIECPNCGGVGELTNRATSVWIDRRALADLLNGHRLQVQIFRSRQDDDDVPLFTALSARASAGEGGEDWRAASMEYDAEECECVHTCLNDRGVPTHHPDGKAYSLWGRVLWFAKSERAK